MNIPPTSNPNAVEAPVQVPTPTPAPVPVQISTAIAVASSGSAAVATSPKKRVGRPLKTSPKEKTASQQLHSQHKTFTTTLATKFANSTVVDFKDMDGTVLAISPTPEEYESSPSAAAVTAAGSECRRSSRKKIIKFDVRDLLSKNRKSHKIQIEARIDSNEPTSSKFSSTTKPGISTEAQSATAATDLTTKQKTFIEKSAIFRRFSNSELQNKMVSPVRPLPMVASSTSKSLLIKATKCDTDIDTISVINRTKVDQQRRLSRTQEIFNATMIKSKQNSSLIVAQMGTGGTNSSPTTPNIAVPKLSSSPARRGGRRRASTRHVTATPTPPEEANSSSNISPLVDVAPPPRRRGRPPKNKTLLQQQQQTALNTSLKSINQQYNKELPSFNEQQRALSARVTVRREELLKNNVAECTETNRPEKVQIFKSERPAIRFERRNTLTAVDQEIRSTRSFEEMQKIRTNLQETSLSGEMACGEPLKSFDFMNCMKLDGSEETAAREAYVGSTIDDDDTDDEEIVFHSVPTNIEDVILEISSSSSSDESPDHKEPLSYPGKQRSFAAVSFIQVSPNPNDDNVTATEFIVAAVEEIIDTQVGDSEKDVGVSAAPANPGGNALQDFDDTPHFSVDYSPAYKVSSRCNSPLRSIKDAESRPRSTASSSETDTSSEREGSKPYRKCNKLRVAVKRMAIPENCNIIHFPASKTPPVTSHTATTNVLFNSSSASVAIEKNMPESDTKTQLMKNEESSGSGDHKMKIRAIDQRVALKSSKADLAADLREQNEFKIKDEAATVPHAYEIAASDPDICELGASIKIKKSKAEEGAKTLESRATQMGVVEVKCEALQQLHSIDHTTNASVDADTNITASLPQVKIPACVDGVSVNFEAGINKKSRDSVQVQTNELDVRELNVNNDQDTVPRVGISPASKSIDDFYLKAKERTLPLKKQIGKFKHLELMENQSASDSAGSAFAFAPPPAPVEAEVSKDVAAKNVEDSAAVALDEVTTPTPVIMSASPADLMLQSDRSLSPTITTTTTVKLSEELTTKDNLENEDVRNSKNPPRRNERRSRRNDDDTPRKTLEETFAEIAAQSSKEILELSAKKQEGECNQILSDADETLSAELAPDATNEVEIEVATEIEVAEALNVSSPVPILPTLVPVTPIQNVTIFPESITTALASNDKFNAADMQLQACEEVEQDASEKTNITLADNAEAAIKYDQVEPNLSSETQATDHKVPYLECTPTMQKCDIQLETANASKQTSVLQNVNEELCEFSTATYEPSKDPDEVVCENLKTDTVNLVESSNANEVGNASSSILKPLQTQTETPTPIPTAGLAETITVRNEPITDSPVIDHRPNIEVGIAKHSSSSSKRSSKSKSKRSESKHTTADDQESRKKHSSGQKHHGGITKRIESGNKPKKLKMFKEKQRSLQISFSYPGASGDTDSFKSSNKHASKTTMSPTNPKSKLDAQPEPRSRSLPKSAEGSAKRFAQRAHSFTGRRDSGIRKSQLLELGSGEAANVKSLKKSPTNSTEKLSNSESSSSPSCESDQSNVSPSMTVEKYHHRSQQLNPHSNEGQSERAMPSGKRSQKRNFKINSNQSEQEQQPSLAGQEEEKEKMAFKKKNVKAKSPAINAKITKKRHGQLRESFHESTSDGLEQMRNPDAPEGLSELFMKRRSLDADSATQEVAFSALKSPASYTTVEEDQDPLKDIEKFIEDGVNLLKRGYKLSDTEDSVDNSSIDPVKKEKSKTAARTGDVQIVVAATPKIEPNVDMQDTQTQLYVGSANADCATTTTTESGDMPIVKIEILPYASFLTPADTPLATPSTTPPPKSPANEAANDESIGVRRSHRIKQITKAPKALVGRGLVEGKPNYSVDDHLMDLAQVEAKNTKFLKEMEERLSNFQVIKENEYKCERIVSKEARKMLCDCFLTSEEEERGEMGCGDDCLNRLLMIECGPDCNVRNRCTNKRFQRFLYSPCRVFRTEKKGFGIMADNEIRPGEFIMEYVGEVIDGDEFERRRVVYSRDRNRHYYFMALRSESVIDATTKGNISRFINHSCDPNAETQKWTVNGELRIGFFSRKTIMPGEEITFDYQYQRYGKGAQRCYCESVNCRGWIGKEPDSDEAEVESDDENEQAEGLLDDDETDDSDGESEDKKAGIAADAKMSVNGMEQKGRSNEKASKDKKRKQGEESQKKKGKKALAKASSKIAKEKKEKNRARNKREEKSQPSSQVSPSKVRYLEDPDIQEEVKFLSRSGLKNQSETLRLSRLMVRAKLVETRLNLLKILRKGELPCRRLFLDYHGMRLLHGWMSEDGGNMDIRMSLLQTLECLPIANKTVLTDSKVLQTVRSWSRTSAAGPSSLSPSDDSSKESSSSSSQQGVNTEMPSDVEKLAVKLTATWDKLPEIFRIPKRERIEQMKEHEREADRQYAAVKENSTQRPIANNDRYQRDRFGRGLTSRFSKPFPSKEPRHITSIGSNIVIDPRRQATMHEANKYLSKEKRREMFAAKVARDEAEKRLAEEKREFETKCRFFGLNPKKTRPCDLPFFVNPVTGQWYSVERNPIPTPPSYGHVQVPLKQKTTNPSDYQLPALTSSLPSHWKFAITPQGKIYYYHVQLRLSQWNPPTPDQLAQCKKRRKSSKSDSETEDQNDSQKKVQEIANLKNMNEIEMKTFVDKEVQLRRQKRYSSLVDSRPISPRREEDRIYNQIEVRKYKENKEKIRKRKEEIRRRRTEALKNKNMQSTLEETGGNNSEQKPKIIGNEDDSVSEIPIQDYLLSSDEEDMIKTECSNSPLIDKIVQGDKIVDELDALSTKRSLKRPLPPYKDLNQETANDIEKLEQKRRKQEKKDRFKQKNKDRDLDPKFRRAKEKFRYEVAVIIVQSLKPYRKDTCLVGRIQTNDDFNHLTRKLTHFVMVKELKYCESVGQMLVVTDSVKNKTREFIKKYMAKYGEVYVKPQNDPEFKEIPLIS